MKKIILIGKPVSHSLSPALHNYWIEYLGVEARYEARETEKEEIPELISQLKNGRLAGINATIPYKEAVFKTVDENDIAAAKIKGANVLYIEDGKLCGRNTDPEGFIANLQHQIPNWEPKGAALILGTGAAARAAIYALMKEGQEAIQVLGRNQEKGKALQDDFGSLVQFNLEPEKLDFKTLSVVINATPKGLPGFPVLDLNLDNLSKNTIVYDLVYGKTETAFLTEAREKGLKTVDGLGMLVFQAIPAFESWFGIRPDFKDCLLTRLRMGL